MDCSPPGSSVHGDSPDKNTGVGCHFLLQGIFLTQRLNPGLLRCRKILYHWATWEAHLGVSDPQSEVLRCLGVCVTWMWGHWDICVSLSQAVTSFGCLGVYMWECVVSKLYLRLWSFWILCGSFSMCTSHTSEHVQVSELICIWPWHEFSEIFVGPLPWLWGVWYFEGWHPWLLTSLNFWGFLLNWGHIAVLRYV